MGGSESIVGMMSGQSIGSLIAMVLGIFSIVSIVFGALLGVLRGTGRSITRLVLVLISLVVAFLVRDYVVQHIFEFQIGGQSIMEKITSGMVAQELPPAILDLIVGMIEVVIGLLVYFAVFMLLSGITWLIIFQILKIFVKKPKKGGSRLVGMAIGAIQGVLVAFIICAPVTGLVNQLDRILQLEFNGEKIEHTLHVDGLHDYRETTVDKIYTETGTWYFEMLAGYKDSQGRDHTLTEVVDVADAALTAANNFGSIVEEMEKINESVTSGESTEILKNLGGALTEIGEKIDSLDGNSKELLTEIVESVAGSAGVEVLEQIKLEDVNLTSAGKAMEAVAEYIEVKEGLTEGAQPEFNEEKIDDIVKGVEENVFILDAIGDTQIVEIEEEDAEKFNDAIEGSGLTDEQKAQLKAILGLN